MPLLKVFLGSLKQERVHWRNYETGYESQQDVLIYNINVVQQP